MTHTESDEIYIRLEHYDDIFSDFDMRPYAKRSLSVDFLEEIKRAANDKHTGAIDLVLYVPEGHRNDAHDDTIKERLSAHFKRHLELLKKERRGVLTLGIGMVFGGVLAMIGATLIAFRGHDDSMLFSFLLVFLEPAAWFLLWEGMDQIVFNAKSVMPELEFYHKMTHTRGHIHFREYKE